jgi:hypothetical protein
MNGDVAPTSEVQMDTKMVLLIRNYTHDSGVATNGITQKSQNGKNVSGKNTCTHISNNAKLTFLVKYENSNKLWIITICCLQI